MRTAREVVNRILTDANLHPGDFFVGYDDRFKGPIEKDFDSFNWSSYSSVDPDADNAVPEHRILYVSVSMYGKRFKIEHLSCRISIFFIHSPSLVRWLQITGVELKCPPRTQVLQVPCANRVG